MSLAQRVRDYRYSKGWGPDELASRAAISRTALYQIESGKTELPRAGTLRRIALALDVSMETLLGHMEATAQSSQAGAVPAPAVKTRGTSEWFPSEGSALTMMSPRPGPRYESPETSRFGVEYAPASSPSMESSLMGRERDLVVKLHELLASPFGEAVARIVDESYRLLPQARMMNSYE